VRIGRALLTAAVVGAVSYAAYRAVQHFAPQGVEAFARQVKDGMAEREAQLREALGAEAGVEDDAAHRARHGSPMTAQEARDLIDDPAGLHPGARSVPPHAPQARADGGS
jgi:hypothetical protein